MRSNYSNYLFQIVKVKFSNQTSLTNSRETFVKDALHDQECDLYSYIMIIYIIH